MDQVRILAFGEHHCHMLATSIKEAEVHFFWTEGKTGFKSACEPVEDFAFRQARALKRRLRRGDYDLILCEAIRHPVIRPGAFLVGELPRAAGKIWRKQQVFGPRLLPWLVRGCNVPLAVIDRSDNPLIGSHSFPLLTCCQAFFKR